ncbi:MAG: hypothetical protein Q4C47_06875 [Planctomycetia bacterium]|nr:hypothetical protein [Planctomycetia bacterium]
METGALVTTITAVYPEVRGEFFSRRIVPHDRSGSWVTECHDGDTFYVRERT